MSFLLSNGPLVHARNMGDTTWDSSKFTRTKGYHPSKSSGDGANSEQMHMPGAKGFLSSKSSVADFSNPGSKGSPYSSHLDAAPEYPRALSLLSNNSWGPESVALNPIHEKEACVTQPTMHGIPEGTPLSSSSSSEFWLHQPSAHQPRLQPWPADANFQEIQLFTPCEETDY